MTLASEARTRSTRSIGPIGTSARVVVGASLVGSVVVGQATAASCRAWALGLVVFPAAGFA